MPMVGGHGRSSVGAVLMLVVMGCQGGVAPTLSGGAHDGLECGACHSGEAVGAIGFTTSQSCDGCHALDGRPVTLAGVTLQHQAHGGGAGLPHAACSSCHTHAGGAEDLSVPVGSCFVCHDTPSASAASAADAPGPEVECTVCHDDPGVSLPAGHALIRERGLSCLQCHYDVVEGDRTVDPRSCRVCHGAGEPTTAGEAHALHYAGGSTPSCGRCHASPHHARTALASALLLDCNECHHPDEPVLHAARLDSSAHQAAQALYAGLVPVDLPIPPATKFVARIGCAACHPPAQARGGAIRHASPEMINRRCGECHGERFRDLMRGWMEGMARHTESVGRYLRTTTAALSKSPEAQAVADSASTLWRWVEEGGGVHNIPAADRLLRRALEDAERAWRLVERSAPRRPWLGPDPNAERCVACHYGIEFRGSGDGGDGLDHGIHTGAAGLACSRCHSDADLYLDADRTFNPEHGRVTVSANDCFACHHRQTAGGDCFSCHAVDALAASVPAALAVQVGDGPERQRSVRFNHEAHGVIACRDCHLTIASAAPGPAVACNTCHADHHQGAGGCAACHTGAEEAHAGLLVPEAGAAHTASTHDVHTACAGCHAAGTVETLVPDRAFCLMCHTDQEAHYSDASSAACVICHFLTDPQVFQARFLSGGGLQ